MTHVVITGASRGIGFGLAQAFLEAGCRVTIGARDASAAERAVSELGLVCARERIAGMGCNVASRQELQALWDFAHALAPVDIWVNNAGVNLVPRPFWESDAEAIASLFTTNLVGVALGTHVALRGMIARGSGKIYNLEGFGADGSMREGLAAYGTSKAAVRYLSRALAAEAKRKGVLVATVDPGVVATGMLQEVLGGSGLGWLTPIARSLARPVAVVAPRLASSMLSNTQSGRSIRAVTVLRLVFALLRAPFRGEPSRLPLPRLKIPKQ